MADLLSAGVSVANGIASYLGAKEQRKWEEQQAQQQQQWNEMMVDKQNAFNLNMWNLQNEYNDPSAQYQRMLNSGYNPLFYGPDGSGNSASALSSAQPLGYERAANVQNPLSAGVQGALSALQIESQAKANISRAKLNESEADWTNAKTVTENLMRGVNFELAGLDVDLKNVDIIKSQREADKLSADIVRINKECDELDAKIQETFVSMDVKQRSQALNELAFAFKKEIESKQLSLDEQRVAIQWYNANINGLLADSQIDVNKHQAIYLDIQGEHISAVTQTENDSREYVVEKAKWDSKQSKRDYKWTPVNNTVRAVGTAVAGFGVAVSSIVKGASAGMFGSTATNPSNGSVAGSQYMQSPVGYD